MPTKVARTEGGISVERLTTHKNENYNQPGCNDCSDYRWRSCQESGEIDDCIQRLTWIRLLAIEDILGDEYELDRLRELVQADREGRCVVLNMPRKPLVWGDDDKNTCLCPYCGKDLMGIPYGERMVLQCPECGQYLDVTKIITRAEAEAALREDTDEH